MYRVELLYLWAHFVSYQQNVIVPVSIYNGRMGAAGEMVQLVRVLLALAEDQGSVARTSKVAHSHV